MIDRYITVSLIIIIRKSFNFTKYYCSIKECKCPEKHAADFPSSVPSELICSEYDNSTAYICLRCALVV